MADEQKTTALQDISKEAARVKPIYKSRTAGIFVAAVTVFVSRSLAAHLDPGWAHDVAAVFADDLVGYLMAGVSLLGVWIKKQDYKKVQVLLDMYAKLKEEHDNVLAKTGEEPAPEAQPEVQPEKASEADKAS